MSCISNRTNRIRINRAIRAKEVRLVSAESKHLGIKPLAEALEMAAEEGLDLVEISPDATPPVCKIMDYGKFKYQRSKREHESRKHQKTIHIKEIKLRPCTGEHDFNFKLKHAQKFLQQGNKVKLNVNFRGRELTHTEIGRELLFRMAEQASEFGEIEVSPKREGRRMIMILAPKSHPAS